MPVPFSRPRAVPDLSWTARLLRVADTDRAGAAVVNLFVGREPAEVTAQDVAGALAAGNLSADRARPVLLDIYRQAIRNFLADVEVTEEEGAYLEALRAALGLSRAEAGTALNDACVAAYETALADLFASPRLDAGVRDRASHLAERLHLSEGAATDTYRAAVRRALEAALKGVLDDRRVTPLEDRALHRLAQELGVTLSMDSETAAAYQRFQRLWEAENGQLPTIEVPIVLQRREVAHFALPGTWHELRTVTTRVDYAGWSGSVRVVRGVRLRVGSVAPRRIARDVLTQLDTGTLYITNQRVIFDGEKANKAIRYTQLLGLQLYSDALQLEKASGKSTYVLSSGDVEMAAVVLSSALAMATS